MAYRLVGQNCAVTIEDGGTQDGAPTYGTALNVKGLARSLRVNNVAETADVSALGDTRRQIQVTRGSTRIEIELLVANDTGEQFYGKIGNYLRVNYKPLSTDASFKTFQGVLVEQSFEAPDGASVERLVIECDANGGSLPA